MEARELRIGNLFIGHNNQIFALAIKDFALLDLDIEVDEIIKEAIPLTPEWLEKAGAEKIREGRYFIGINPITDDYLMVIGGNADGFYFQNAGHPLRFVHQLQNLWHALAGEELQFKDKS